MLLSVMRETKTRSPVKVPVAISTSIRLRKRLRMMTRVPLANPLALLRLRTKIATEPFLKCSLCCGMPDSLSVFRYSTGYIVALCPPS